ncbi:phosphomevalonate kinase [Streptomyces sparsus]
MNAPLVRRAPGKLLIAGEYAVLTAGRPAVVAALDRYVSVTVAPAQHADVELFTDLLDRPLLLRRKSHGLAPVGGTGASASPPAAFVHLLAVLATVDELTTDLGLPLTPVRLGVTSNLHENGVKIGLGSSGAVTAAATHALTDYRGLHLTAELRLRLALLATVIADPHASGADAAASTWGGWIRYTAPDRAQLRRTVHCHGVAATLRARWPALSLRPLPPPPVALQVCWTGSPASTPAQVGRLQDTTWWNGDAHHQFLTDSDHLVDDLVHALDCADQQAAVHAVDAARALLADLDGQTSLGIFTPALGALCDGAQAAGGSGKPSGAGGGDCGIALLPPHAEPATLHRLWKTAGLTPLTVRTAAREATHLPDAIGPDPACVLPAPPVPTPRTPL